MATDSFASDVVMNLCMCSTVQQFLFIAINDKILLYTCYAAQIEKPTDFNQHVTVEFRNKL